MSLIDAFVDFVKFNDYVNSIILLIVNFFIITKIKLFIIFISLKIIIFKKIIIFEDVSTYN